jgi:hypothetical protein
MEHKENIFKVVFKNNLGGVKLSEVNCDNKLISYNRINLIGARLLAILINKQINSS